MAYPALFAGVTYKARLVLTISVKSSKVQGILDIFVILEIRTWFQNFREHLIIINSSLPHGQESSDVKSFWIPAGVYPDENRGRNNILRGSL